MSSAWLKSWGASWGGSWGAITPSPIVDDTSQYQGGWIGEWLPIPIPRKLQPTPPRRKAKVSATGPAPRATIHARNKSRRHARAALVVHDGPVSEIVCRVDMSAVHEEETILAALAAIL